MVTRKVGVDRGDVKWSDSEDILKVEQKARRWTGCTASEKGQGWRLAWRLLA